MTHSSAQEVFKKTITPKLQKELGIKNIHMVPRLEKVVINTGLGRASQQASFQDKLLVEIEKDLTALCGQKPSRRGAKKSIAGFKLREGQVIGLATTLRGNRMFEFIAKLTHIAYPRVRDFRGINLKNIDTRGNLNLGLKEQMIFPEINPETSLAQFGIQITLVAKNADHPTHARALYEALGFKFKDEQQVKKKSK